MTDTLPTLRSRLALRAFVYALLALAFIGVMVWFATERALSDRTDTAATDYLLTLTSELAIASSPTDPNVTAGIQSAGEDRVAQIIELAAGTVVAGTSGLAEPLIEPDSDLVGSQLKQEVVNPLDQTDTLLVEGTVMEVGGRRYMVLAGASAGSSIFDNPGTLAGSIAAALLIAIGLGVGVWLSVRSALKPVERLADEADHAATGRMTERWALGTPATTAEIDRLIEHLNSLLSSVQESQAHERAFLEDASHDLRTPIAVARAELDLAMSTTREEETREALGSAIEELDRLDRLAADLLILARMRVAPAHPPQQVRLGTLVRKAAARLMRGRYGPQVKVTVEGDADALGDPATLERAIENILSNAIRHTSSSVQVVLDGPQASARIRFSDDGPGFPAALLESATFRFSRGSGHGEGAGLGLAIASAIAEANGGSLTLSNRKEGGALVTMSLPAGPESNLRSTEPAVHRIDQNPPLV